ncbi:MULTISPECIES: YrdB family protein [Mumia]|uniref:YrdB family protein n=1 Tax=Mumia TaxID=1546255 RepID=UPI001421442C|nr:MULTISPECIES: YrdB family protein [unclassified Mumia]QMW66890.1 YrdB family protein [Mumia sp. ZJ1417]
MSGAQPEAQRVGPLDLLAFTCELAALVLLALAGWVLGDGWWRGLVLAAALVAVAVWFWGRWLAPTSPRRVAMPQRLWVKAAFYIAVGTLGALAGFSLWALVLVAVAVTTAALRRD